MTEVELSGGIVMRPYRREDADAVFEAVQSDRDRLARFMPWVWASTSPRHTETFIAAAVESRSEGTALHWGLFESDRCVGSVGAGIDRLNGNAEAGYWIAPAFEGRGLVTRAMGVVIDVLIARGVRRMVLRAAVENTRSRSVAERLGFTLEGIERESLRTGDVIHDTAVYSLLAREWPSGLRPAGQ